MEIFVFASKNLTNIWAGIGAKMWAVSDTGDASTRRGRTTKSRSMKIGSLGILYCNETHSLTTPFIVYSRPDPKASIDDVWPERWILPFKILPLGSPELQLHKDEAKRVLPIFKKCGELNFSKVFHVQAITAFAATTIGAEDWEVLIERLTSEHQRNKNQ